MITPFNDNPQIASLLANKKICVAVSGGSDSMALLHLLCAQKQALNAQILALNVEHGIRGESSISDTEFVKDYCAKNSIPLLTYAVNAPEYAKTHSLTLEQAARELRYDCFFNALTTGKCDLVATAHHAQDNLESVLFNLFRGSGLKGACGIELSHQNKIVRPLLYTPKKEIDEYVKAHGLPYVTDQTNFCADYTRNAIRLNVLSKIKELFPDCEGSITRFCQAVTADNAYLTELANATLTEEDGKVKIKLPQPQALLTRATVLALKKLGVKKDWAKPHIASALTLATAQSGKRVDLLDGVTLIKEYDALVFCRMEKLAAQELPLFEGTARFLDKKISLIRLENKGIDYKNGLYIAAEKLPKTAVIRTRREGDYITKFGGGTKSLSDYLTDQKIPPTERDRLAVIACGSQILAIFGLAISQTVAVDQDTKSLYKMGVE